MAAHPLENISELARAAREESARMLAAANGHAGDVRVPAEQFRKLARLLGALGRSAGCCGGADCMGAPVDGVKLWVTSDACSRAVRASHRPSALADDLLL